MTFPKGTLVGQYIIVEFLNRGGMAEVYRARSEKNQTEVALKLSLVEEQDPKLNNALRFEVALLSQLNHPGVVRVMPVTLAGERQIFMARALNLPDQPWYFIMEYLPGGTLSGILKRRDVVRFDVACGVTYALLDTLAYLHQKEVVHLDIKPENILLKFLPEKENRISPVLIDFGVSAMNAQYAKPKGGTTVTMPAEYIRKLRGELPPEQGIDLKKVDIYALGIVFYRMITGKYPFDGLTRRSVTSAILNGQIDPPTKYNASLPAGAEDLIMRWLSKDPFIRPSLEELRTTLSQWEAPINRFPETIQEKAHWWKLWSGSLRRKV